MHPVEDLHRKTPLHIAVENGHTEVMRQLVEADEDFQVDTIYALLMKTMKRMTYVRRLGPRRAHGQLRSTQPAP